MPARLWRILALMGALTALVFVIVETADLATFTDSHVQYVPVDGRTFAKLRVIGVSGTPAETGGIEPGDVLSPVGPVSLRLRLDADFPGAKHDWIVRRGALPPFRTQTHVTQQSPNDLALIEIFNVVRLAMLFVAILVAARRPELPAARALVTFLITMAVTLMPGGVWLPDPALASWRVVRGPLQIYSLSQGMQFACIFPFVSTHGLRVWLQRVNPWYCLVTATSAFVVSALARITGAEPDIGRFADAINWSPIAYFPLMFLAFTLAGRQATAGDRVRVQWVSRAIGLGFLGPLIQTIAYVSFGRVDGVLGFLPLTLIAIPVGLAYTILRHRTVDVGFVISRALVLTILSFSVIAAFGLVERTLGKLVIDASHVASRTVELALALGLGFSLRTLHARIERIVDNVFFRQRQLALAALRAFAGDVYFITDPDVAIERTVDVAGHSADAENAALYLIADGVFGRASALYPDALPDEIGADDPLFVRMRASRKPALARDAGSSLDVEIAFPMFVRGTLVGALALAVKRSGEAYDPEETALLAELAQRVGSALDALQTIAMRRELEALMRT